MSVTTPPAPAPAAAVSRRTIPGWAKALLGVALILLVLSLTRVISGAQDLTSSGTAAAALTLAMPILLAGLGGLWSERAGVVNIGLEGMMILGTWCAAFGALKGGPWIGLLAGVLGGALGGLLHAVATVTFGVDQIVSGVAINLIGPGVARFLSALLYADVPGGGVTQSPPAPQPPTLTLPWFTDAMTALESQRIFFVSDAAGILAGLTTNVSWASIIGLALVPLSAYALWRTRFGLRLRSCGENPYAAESLGVNVYLYKYIAVIISGGLAGLGGAFLSLVATNFYREGQTGGRGFIGLAAMIFGNWRPGGLAMGAGLFGYTNALQLRQGSVSVHALLLSAAMGLVILGVYMLRQASGRTVGIVSLVLAAGMVAMYVMVDTIPSQFVGATPYVTTLLVLALASQNLRMPAADGQVYRKGTAK